MQCNSLIRVNKTKREIKKHAGMEAGELNGYLMEDVVSGKCHT